MIISKAKRRRIIQPQLIAMLDVCSMITIFLLAGSFMGPEAIQLPRGTILADSIGKVMPDMASQLVISGKVVDVSFLEQKYSLEYFTGQNRKAEFDNSLKQRIKDYIKTKANVIGPTGLTLNVVADRRVYYKDLFEVIAVFRQNGFETISLIASNDGHVK